MKPQQIFSQSHVAPKFPSVQRMASMQSQLYVYRLAAYMIPTGLYPNQSYQYRSVKCRSLDSLAVPTSNTLSGSAESGDEMEWTFSDFRNRLRALRVIHLLEKIKRLLQLVFPTKSSTCIFKSSSRFIHTLRRPDTLRWPPLLTDSNSWRSNG